MCKPHHVQAADDAIDNYPPMAGGEGVKTPPDCFRLSEHYPELARSQRSVERLSWKPSLVRLRHENRGLREEGENPKKGASNCLVAIASVRSMRSCGRLRTKRTA